MQHVLADGVCIPTVGLGTFQIKGQQAVRVAVESALAAGYTLIGGACTLRRSNADTAAVYRNEAEIGAALRDSRIHRDRIFITSKICK